jgi:hypothetical protein
VTERFTRAVDQLGSTQLDVRLGGIYALERIARDSRTDQPTIAEILTAYVRTHSPWPPTRPGQGRIDLTLDQVRDLPDLRTRMPDVQAALTVLGRGEFALLAATSSAPLDLRATDLRTAELRGANLERAAFFGAHLEQADLLGAHLEGANLRLVHLEGAILADAHMQGANLVLAHLEKAQLAGANLQGASLSAARLAGAYLDGAHLAGAEATESADWPSTEWPDGFDRRAAGVLLVDGRGRPVPADSAPPDAP